MGARLSKFQMQSFTNWGGFVPTEQIDKYWLGGKLMRDQAGGEKIIRTLLDYHYGPGLESVLSKYPTKEIDDDEAITWGVQGSNYRNIPLIEARDFDGNVIDMSTSTNVGVGLEPFYLVFGEQMFFDGEYIVGNLNEVYQFRILDDPREEGMNYVYKVELAGGNTTGCPPERLLPGEKFSKEAAFVESELSRKVGNITYSRAVGMRNDWSTVRIHTKVGGDAINKQLKYAVAVPEDENGKTKIVNNWISWVELELEKEFRNYKNRAMLFGRSNRNDNGEYLTKGKSGISIKTGAGLLEQIEVANTYYYNDKNCVFDMMLEAIQDLADSLDISQRKFIVNTGTRGATVIHESMCKKVGSWVPFTFNGDQLGVINKVKNAVNQTSLSAGFQFVEYHGPNGIILSINVDRFYDDPVRNKVLMPGTNSVAMSYRYDIIYAGNEAEPNIARCKIKNRPEERGYQWGFRNPFTGAHNNGNMSYDEDSATVHRMAKFGIVVYDPTQVVSFIPSVLLG